MRNKNTKHILFFMFLAIFAGIVFFTFQTQQSHAAAGPYDYQALEPIPGSPDTGANLKKFLEAIYKFAIWTVGIAAILMITIGGFMYMMSAGNNSKMEIAKGVITDALIGLIVVLTAYLVLYVINPDLVKITIKLESLGTSNGTSTPTPKDDGSCSPACESGKVCKDKKCVNQKPGSGKCEPVTSGPCSVANLKTKCFGEANAEKASSICNAESGGIETKASGVDICQPGGEVASFGLFQFNLTANKMGGLNCPATKGAFDKMFTGKNKQCNVINKSLYNDCVAAAKNADKNIQAACTLSKNGTKWSAWGANKKCGF